MKKLLSIEDYKKEILERLIEFRHEGADPFHDLAYEFTQWAIADDVRRYVHLRYSMGHNKENIIDGVYELIATISDHGLINSKIPEHKKIIKAEERKQKKIEEKLKKDPKNRMLYLNKNINIIGEDIHSIFANMSLEKMHAWFEDFKHLDWFEQYFEIYIKGSGPDLVDLTNYAFMGYLNCSFDRWMPWTLRDLCRFRGRKGFTKRIDPLIYIHELIKNCKKFVAEHPGDRSALGDGNLLFKKIIRHAETRLQLDTKKYVRAEDFAYISGINIRTLSNIGLIQKKKSGEEAKILSKDALNFILKNKKPDGSQIRNTRNRAMVQEGLSRNFYSSIWQEQIFYSISICYEEWNDSLYWKPITCFKKINKFNSNTVLRKTNKNLSPRMAIHNRARVEWIGDGKTFEEINSPNSPYRNNIKRKTYIGNKSSIIKDLEYDLHMGWIKLS